MRTAADANAHRQSGITQLYIIPSHIKLSKINKGHLYKLSADGTPNDFSAHGPKMELMQKNFGMDSSIFPTVVLRGVFTPRLAKALRVVHETHHIG